MRPAKSGGISTIISAVSVHDERRGWMSMRPGGVLIALALPKIDLPRDIPVEALSVVGHRLMGAAFRLEQALTGRRRYAYESSVHVMPMQDAVLTTRQVRAQATRVLPGVHVRRLPFWRYELRWRRPR